MSGYKLLIRKIITTLFLVFFIFPSLLLSACGTKKEPASLEETTVTTAVTGKDPVIKESATSTATEIIPSTTRTTVQPENTSAPEFNSDEPYDSGDINDLKTQRHYFILGVEAFENEEYVKAQYYLEKIKYKYIVLEDHIRYYLAKSTLLQKKYDLSALNYQYIIDNYKTSIFRERSFIELSDSYYLGDDFETAREKYASFTKEYPDSALIPYALFQQGVCLEKTRRPEEAYAIYKKIYLLYPQTEYSVYSLNNLNRLSASYGLPDFSPTVEELYSRGEKLFKIYYYDLALETFDRILQNSNAKNNYPGIYSKTLFKTGMSFFNMNNYKNAKDYLQKNYDSYPGGDLADDSLYYLGRCLTNLNDNDGAIKMYQKLLELFPSSNFADDSLYRIGRIFHMTGNLRDAAAYYQRIINEYPSGDRITDSYWELGWIQYSLDEYDSSVLTFDKMSKHFKGTQLEEKSLFWKAKSLEKMNNMTEAIETFKNVSSLNPLSYYGFEARNTLQKLGITIKTPIINKKLDPEDPGITSLIPEIYQQLEPQIIFFKEDATHINKAKELLFIRFYDSAASEIEASGEETDADLSKILGISTLYLKSRDFESSILLIQRNYKKLSAGLSGNLLDYYYFLFYPFAYKEYVKKYSQLYGLEENFVLAIIREESRFKADAGSHAGAQGLMQIMPATGKSIANQLGIANFNNDMLHDPETSIMMGTYYISRQLDNFENNKYYALGAYNGGPGAMARWISNYNGSDINEFIERITYDETRNYIKKVMESYYIYNILY